MTEVRQRQRHKGAQFNPAELSSLLYAFGDLYPESLPATVRVLDEIVTDYVIETCHAANVCASYNRRNKIKVDDFKFMLRRDNKKLGRVMELLHKNKELKEARKVTNADEVAIREAKAMQRQEERASRKKRLAEMADEEEGEDGAASLVEGSVAGTGKTKSTKRGRKKSRRESDVFS